MGTKINRVRYKIRPDGILLSSWLSDQDISCREQTNYVRSGTLQRIASGAYKFSDAPISLYGILSSYQLQGRLNYHIGAATALEIKGFSHYIPMGKPKAVIFTPVKPRLPKWITSQELDMAITEVSTKVFGQVGIEEVQYNGYSLRIAAPERAIMECLLLSPTHYNLMDVYYLMEMLTNLRATLAQNLLETCSSVKVKRLFLYMAEKAGHRWFGKLNLSKVTLGSGTRALVKGGVKNAKYNIMIPLELAHYE